MKRGAGGALAVALAAVAPFAAAAGFLTAYPDAPPPGTTGGFGEPTCVSCHFATTPDSLGSLALRGLPATFEAGRTYELTVELARADMAAAGFQLSARFASGPARGRQAGAFRILGDHAAVTAQSGVDYVHQTLAGAVPSTPGLARWGIEWTAPGKGSASVRFHIAANAANGDESPLGRPGLRSRGNGPPRSLNGRASLDGRALPGSCGERAAGGSGHGRIRIGAGNGQRLLRARARVPGDDRGVPRDPAPAGALDRRVGRTARRTPRRSS